MILILMLMLLIILPNKSFSQESTKYDEISIFVDVYRVGGTEIPGVISGQKTLLSVTSLFDFLKIRNIPSYDFDSITGFFINKQAVYLIDESLRIINFKNKVYNIDKGCIISTSSNLYLDIKYFGEIFSLNCMFDYRKLMVTLTTDLDLPIIREMRLAVIHKNAKLLSGEKEADTIIGRSYPLFSFGMADWSLNSTQQTSGIKNTRFNIDLGSIIAGGETNIGIRYDSDQPFTGKQQYYNWRLANNDFKYIKQIIGGKINTFATSSIFDPVVGLQLTNTPTSYRKSYGTYTLSDYTNPNWTVELYVNKVLIDYVEADASGFFTFEVPLIYGKTQITLRYYGPWGEEISKEQHINIPYNFIPKGKLEYLVSGGVVEDIYLSKYCRAELNYGVGHYMTLGGGAEYLSSVTSGSFMPFFNTSFSVRGKLLFTGSYTFGVRARVLLNYRFASGLQFDMEYTKYDEGQKAINYNYKEVRKAIITLPLKSRNISVFTRFSLSQFILPHTQYTNAELLVSAIFFGTSANYTVFSIFSDQPEPVVYSNLSISRNILKNIKLRAHVQYDFMATKFISAKCDVERKFFQNGYLTVSYEENIISNTRSFQLGIRYGFSFAQTSLYVRTGSNNTSYYETIRGSIQYDNKSGYFNASNYPVTGRGGVVVLPFLDLNNNYIYDKNEPKVIGLEVKVTGGRIAINESDTTIVISELEPYSNCFIELGVSRFDNIAWILKNKSIVIAINANQLRLLEVPVSIVGEVSGTIYKKKANLISGQERIRINIYDTNGRIVASTISEYDGYYSYLGLAPGGYTVSVDSEQLIKLKMKELTDGIGITVRPSIDGDFIEGIDFIISDLAR